MKDYTMHLDALTLAALADELGETLRGARIDDAIQPTPFSIALQCWGAGRNRWLLASAHPQLARVHLVDEKPRKLTAEPPAFVMLLRKHLEGARIVEVRQPRWERVLEFGFARGPQGATRTTGTWLTIEIMGRLSNVILRDGEGEILGALHLVTSAMNRYRTIAPHVAYRYPPPQTRILGGETVPRLRGEAVTPAELHAAAASVLTTPPPATGRKRGRDIATLAAMLSAQIEGFSREVGREVAARTLGTPEAPLTEDLPWDDIAPAIHALAALPESHQWQPTLVYADEQSASQNRSPVAYAVYEPRQYMGNILREASSVDAMLATYYRGAEWHTSVEGAKGDLRHLLQTLRDRAVRKSEALHADLRALDEAQRLREEADILLAFQSEVPPNVPSVTLLNPFTESEQADPVTITLDPALSTVENANRLYARYHKLQRATEQIPAQITASELELARIEQLRTDLALAETPAEIAHVRAEVIEAGYLRGKPEKKAKLAQKGKNSKKGKAAQSARKPEGGAPLRLESSDGLTLLVGKNSRQNEEVTFHLASPNDVWLHARGVPGSHVIIKNGGRPVPATTLSEAAALAAYYSQAREQGTAPVDHTDVRYVRHMRGGGPGMVIYEREKTIYVTPQESPQV